MRQLSPRELRDIRDLLEVSNGSNWPNAYQRALASIDRALSLGRSVKLARKRVATKRESRKERVAKLRQEVAIRARNWCEATCSMQVHFGGLELDHFFGGSRRRSVESFQTCWLLCQSCHKLKTANVPSPEAWLNDFIRHCEQHGFQGAKHLAMSRLCLLEKRSQLPFGRKEAK